MQKEKQNVTDRWFQERLLTTSLEGVTRVRILPADHAEELPGFFTHAIDCGTEVIAS